MTFRTITITSHPSTVAPVTVPDMGFDVPSASGTITISDHNRLEDIANSCSLRDLATDAAFPAGAGTLSINDGADIPPVLVSARLDSLTRFEEDWIVVAASEVVVVDGDVVVAIGP